MVEIDDSHFEGLTYALCKRSICVWLLEDPEFVKSCKFAWNLMWDVSGYTVWLNGFLDSFTHAEVQKMKDKVSALRIVQLAKEGNEKAMAACEMAGVKP